MNIPKTNFFEGDPSSEGPTGFNPKDFEERVLNFWEENKVFEKSLEQTKDGKPFTFYDGPPFATGLPHYGHILASTIKDLIPRYQTMRGRYVRRRWGWDCHGLPIEEIVERQLKISGKKQIEELGIRKFNETCRSTVLRFADEWKKTIRRIARWTEFDNSYKTMDRTFMESVWWGFKQVYDKGLVYEGRKVLLYCPRCETPVSNFEVAMDNSYKDVTETSVTAKFKVKNPEKLGYPEDSVIYLLAWTTTPWTLPANVALAIGKDIEYVMWTDAKEGVGTESYIMAAPRFNTYGIQSGAVPISAQQLTELAYEPLFNAIGIKDHPKSHRVYSADFVTTTDGTGIVHTAVVYGEDDYNLGLREGMAVVPLLDEKGKFNDKAPELVRGMYFKDADKVVIADLEKRGLLFRAEPYEHSYPHCWRCGTALYYNAIPSWFVNIQKIKAGLQETNKNEMNWFPEHLKHGRYEKSVEQAPDWNISRNRYWGNPIPVWRCESNAKDETRKACEGILVSGSVKDLGLVPTTFYFSRHGEAENNTRNICSSYPEITACNLTDAGKDRAEQLGEQLKAQGGVDLIISSDILRTKETAKIAGKVLGAPVTFDERLREYNVGVWNGKSDKDFGAAFPNADRWTKAPEGGETWTDLRARMLDCISELARKHSGKRILVVSHGDALWTLMQHFNVQSAYPQFATPFKVEVDLPDLHRPYIDDVVLACKKCGGEMHRTVEVFDSWVEAGSMPFAELHYPFENKALFDSRFPAQFVVEYIAQTRAWFYVMHVLSYVLFGHAPVENLVTTGTILAEDGSKMSKSKNNFPDPWMVLDKYGADALRFYLANSVVMLADNVNFSEREVGNVYRKMTLIWKNVLNYYQTYNLEPITYNPELIASNNVLDQWIVARTQELVNTVTEQLDAYNTVQATRAMADYMDDLSTWYLRRSRGRTEKEFFITLRHCLLVSAKVMAPVMPYMSEAVYQVLNARPETISVHLAEWPETKELSGAERKTLSDMRIVRELASAGQALRKEANIPVRQPLAGLRIKNGELGIKNDEKILEIIKSEINVKEIVFDASIANAVELDTELTPELRQEGLVRGLERAIQGLRKEQGFKVGEKARLVYATDDADIVAALEAFNKEKTYIAETAVGIPQGEPMEIEGKKFSLGLKRF